MNNLFDQFDLLLKDHQDELFKSLNPEVAAVHERQVIRICEHYKNQLLLVLGSTEIERKVSIFISNQRKQVVLLKNRIYLRDPERALRAMKAKRVCLGLILSRKLSEIENYLTHVISDELVLDEVVSELDAATFRQELKEMVTLIEERGKIYKNEVLFEVLLAPLKQLPQTDLVTIARRRVEFLKVYAQELKAFDFGINSTSTLRQMKRFALRMRLNSHRAFNYLTECILDKIVQTGDYGMRVEVLIKERKKIATIQEYPMPRFDEQENSLKELLLSWIDHELSQTEKEIGFEKELAELRPTKHKKLQLNMSVGAIAFMLRMMAEEKMVESDSVQGLMDWASGSLSSKKAETISKESLRSKAYDLPDAGRKQIEAGLQKLLSALQKVS